MPTSEKKDLEAQHLEVKTELVMQRLKILQHRAETLKRRNAWDFDEPCDVLRFYLMQKHHWLPRDVRALSDEDLEFATEDFQDV